MNNQNNFNDSKSHHTDNNEINERKISYNKRSNNIDKTIDQIVNNKILDYINELRQDILYLKSINNKDMQNHNENDEEIKQLQIKNEKLIEEIDKIKNELKTLFEENERNKEEIISLKNIVNYKSTPTKEITNIKSEKDIEINSDEDNTIKEIIQMNEKSIMFSKEALDTFKKKKKGRNKSRNKSRKGKSKSRPKSKSQRKSVLFDENNSKEENYNNKSCIGVFLFRQKFQINENETELDLTNKKIGDRGIESLSQIEFTGLKSLSLDTNGIFNIQPLKNMFLNDLQVLNLDNNSINDISILEFVKFPSLQVLWLNNNNISDISVFERAKFSQLQHLYLNNNNISDISVLEEHF